MNPDESKKDSGAQQSTASGLAAAMAAFPIPAITLDVEGRITDVNAAFETETGHSRARLVGTSFWDCFAYPEDAKAAFEATLREGILKDRPLELVRREGFPLPVHLNAAVYHDAAGKAAGVVATPRNVGAFKRTELEFQKKCETLEQRILDASSQVETANRELDAFPFWIIDDLKAPLHSITVSVTALGENRIVPLLEVAGGPGLERIRLASAAMNGTMEGLRKLSAVGRQKLERVTVDLTALVNRLAENLQKTESERKVTFVIAPEMVAHGDPALLQTLFERLIGSAWKSLAGESTPVIEIGVLEGEDVRAFFVRDNSFSSPAPNTRGLLRPTGTARSTTEFSDTGVSRAIVRRIVHRHGGRIWAESHRGKGTAFYFTIPN